jgi:hypothetical protein
MVWAYSTAFGQRIRLP